MPEIIEVNLTAQYLNHKLKGRYLSDIVILGGRYSRHPMIGLQYFKKNKPFIINKVDSKGKFLWFELSNDKKKECYIFNTFALEGHWGLIQEEHSGVKFIIKNKTKDKTYNLYYSDSRNFGTIKIVSNKKLLDAKLNSLGPDLLKIPLSNKEFDDRLYNYITNGKDKINKDKANKKIIEVLMDQSNKGLGSGLGNYLAVEQLFLAGISPYSRIIDIYNNKTTSHKLAHAIRYVLRLAYMTSNVGYLEHLDKSIAKFIISLRKDIINGEKQDVNFYSDVILKKDDIFQFNVYQQKKDPYGNDIVASKIIKGRTTYWSPNIQKL